MVRSLKINRSASKKYNTNSHPSQNNNVKHSVDYSYPRLLQDASNTSLRSTVISIQNNDKNVQ